MEFSIFITEGIHDLMLIYKILKLKGFSEIMEKNEVPEGLHCLIPKQFPFESDRLDRISPCPTFMKGEKRNLVLKQAGSDSKLIMELNGMLKIMPNENMKNLKSIAIIADADEKTAEEKIFNLQKDINNYNKKGEPIVKYLDIKKGMGEIFGNEIKYFTYVFPNDADAGFLEEVIIEGGAKSYNDLLEGANNFISGVNKSYKSKWKPSDEKKSLIGIAGNILKPGKANSVTIADNDWITKESIKSIKTHKLLSDFIDKVIG